MGLGPELEGLAWKFSLDGSCRASGIGTAGSVPMDPRDIPETAPTLVPESNLVTKGSGAFGDHARFAYDKTCCLLSTIF
jgi:hypothetical protein